MACHVVVNLCIGTVFTGQKGSSGRIAFGCAGMGVEKGDASVFNSCNSGCGRLWMTFVQRSIVVQVIQQNNDNVGLFLCRQQNRITMQSSQQESGSEQCA